MAAASSVTSPLCTWLVAACMSVTCGGDQSTCPSMLGSSSYSRNKRLFGSKWGRRKRVFLSKCSSELQSQRDLISSLCGSSFQGLMTSCLAFEPCNQYYASNASFSSLFGSSNVRVPSNRRHTRFNRAVRSGEAMAVAVQPSKEVATKKKPVTKQRRVVVTGMGVVTPLGHDPDVFYNNLLEGVSGVSEIEAFDCAQFPTRIAGEIKSFSTDGWVAPKLSKRMDKFMLYMLTAGKKALADGGITEDVMNELDKVRCGVLIGSAMGGMKVFNDAIEALRISYKKMNPFCVPFATTNMGSAMLAMDLGWMGPNYSISTACATSNFCIMNAANHIIRGEADVMLSGGSDAAIIPIGLGGFVACRALSQRNSDPTKASRPWDSNRDGFVMGEGAGVLLLEELEHAKRRGANIYAEFLGGSFTCDAYHMTEPHPDVHQIDHLNCCFMSTILIAKAVAQKDNKT
uniref:beta-ketoacyl-[acyl-carrier-protein] synthase I n=1 Tax=Quercus lobata TaxID=97700 RepID=A0A7N2MU81_QUELO